MLPVGRGGSSSTHPVPHHGRGEPRNTQRARPGQSRILGRTPPCDLIAAEAVGQDSWDAHGPPRHDQAEEVWQPERPRWESAAWRGPLPGHLGLVHACPGEAREALPATVVCREAE